ncbi:hypothetical protein [Kineococcus terrestris]|uniref:hypothetical protein n=1 Tax=Kineococcus terrestris TaxID=2044856 RepID=UPI0034DB5551
MRKRSALVRAATASVAVGLVLATAPPASAAVTDLTLVASCVVGQPGFVASFTQDGSATVLQRQGDAPVAVPVDARPGPVRVHLPAESLGRAWDLLDGGGRVLATASAADRGCDGWPSAGAYLASGDASPGAPQSLSGLAQRPSTTPDGTQVFRAANGSFVLPPREDGHVVRGAIHDRWLAEGGPASRLGLPTTSEFGVTTLDGYYTRFRGGTVYWSPAGGARAVRGAIAQGYASRDFERGTGLPTSEEFGPLLRGGYGQHFTRGSLYWSPGSGVWRVQGAVRDRWAALGWERSVLGYPVSDEQPVLRGGVGRVQHFQGGSVYWRAETGAHPVRGAVRDTWDRLGGPNGLVGMPVGAEFGPLAGGGYGQHFTQGSVYWSPATGGHSVLETGGVRARWAELGWERGIGYPTSDTFVGLRDQWKGQHFERGSLYSRSFLGDPAPVFLVQGLIRDLWGQLGWENGEYGYPTSQEYAVPGGRRQDFEGGSLTALDLRP